MELTKFEQKDLLVEIQRCNREIAERCLQANKYMKMIEERDLVIEKCITAIQNLQAQITDGKLLSRQEILNNIINNREIIHRG